MRTTHLLVNMMSAAHLLVSVVGTAHMLVNVMSAAHLLWVWWELLTWLVWWEPLTCCYCGGNCSPAFIVVGTAHLLLVWWELLTCWSVWWEPLTCWLVWWEPLTCWLVWLDPTRRVRPGHVHKVLQGEAHTGNGFKVSFFYFHIIILHIIWLASLSMISKVLPWYKMVHRTSWLPQNVGWSCTQQIKFLLCTVYTFQWESRARFCDLPIFVLYFYDSVYLPQPGSFSSHSYFSSVQSAIFFAAC